MSHSCLGSQDQDSSFTVCPSIEGYTTYWVISDYLNLIQGECSFDSPAFGDFEEIQFYVRVSPKEGNGLIEKDCFYLRCRSSGNHSVLGNWALYFVNKIGEKVELVKEEFLAETKAGDQTVGTCATALRSNIALSFLNEGRLTVCCYVKTEMLGVEKADLCAKRRKDFVASMIDLLVKGELADCTLSVGGEVIGVHKCVLSAHSPLFASILGQAQPPDVPNITMEEEVHLVRELLFYMYTGRSPNLKSLAGDLIPLADKYAIQGMINLCENVLIHGLTAETAGDALTLASKYDLKELKDHAVEFIKVSYADVKVTEGWKNAVYLAPESAAEVVKYISLQQSSCSNKTH